VSTEAVDNLDSEEGWQQLRRELDDIGISRRVMSQNREFIVQWFKDALARGLLDERRQNPPIPEVQSAPEVQSLPDVREVPIMVKSLCSKDLIIHISLESKGLDLKDKIQDRDGTPQSHQYLFLKGLNGRPIPEGSILRDCGVREGSKIEVLFPIWHDRRL
jgi:hypothetical protein